jgi:hypothetical protein
MSTISLLLRFTRHPLRFRHGRLFFLILQLRACIPPGPEETRRHGASTNFFLKKSQAATDRSDPGDDFPASLRTNASEEQGMKRKVRMTIGSTALAGTILLLTAADAQQRGAVVSSRPTAYDATREKVLHGTVLSYTEDSSRPPMGAHVMVQTASGPVDAHLGPASYLRSNHFSLATGESVQLVGVSVPTKEGTVFLARIGAARDTGDCGAITQRIPAGE